MIFSEEHIRLILQVKKTQTRRRHVRVLKVGRVYRIQRSWYEWTDIRILITRAFQQRLGDITEEDAEKEGGYTIEEFRKIWENINGNWNPAEVIWAYEFKVWQPRKTQFLFEINELPIDPMPDPRDINFPLKIFIEPLDSSPLFPSLSHKR